MKLVFPFSWDRWQIYLIRSDDYWVTIIEIIATLLIYGIYWFQAKKKSAFSGSKIK